MLIYFLNAIEINTLIQIIVQWSLAFNAYIHFLDFLSFAAQLISIVQVCTAFFALYKLARTYAVLLQGSSDW